MNESPFFVKDRDRNKYDGCDEHRPGKEPEIAGAFEFAGAIFILDEEINPGGEKIAKSER